MFKLAAAIRSHFVVVPHIESKGFSAKSPGQIFAPTVPIPRISWRFPNAVAAKLSTVLPTRLRPGEIEEMNASLCEHRPPVSTPSLLPDSTLTSLAGKAPALCAQLQRIGR
jgi:hypothetical protein